MYLPLVGGEVIGVKEVPGIAIAVARVTDGVAEFQAYQVTGQVWHGNEYRVTDDQFGEYLGTAHGPAVYGAALDFMAKVILRLRAIAAESN